jgi:hypothetical protein
MPSLLRVPRCIPLNYLNDTPLPSPASIRSSSPSTTNTDVTSPTCLCFQFLFLLLPPLPLSQLLCRVEIYTHHQREVTKYLRCHTITRKKDSIEDLYVLFDMFSSTNTFLEGKMISSCVAAFVFLVGKQNRRGRFTKKTFSVFKYS